MKYLYLLLLVVTTGLNAQRDLTLDAINSNIDTVNASTLSQTSTGIWLNSGSRITSIGRLTNKPDSVSYDTTEIAAFIFREKFITKHGKWEQDTSVNGRYSIGRVVYESVPSFKYDAVILKKITKATFRWEYTNPYAALYVSDNNGNTYPIGPKGWHWIKLDTSIKYYLLNEEIPVKLIFSKVELDD